MSSRTLSLFKLFDCLVSFDFQKLHYLIPEFIITEKLNRVKCMSTKLKDYITPFNALNRVRKSEHHFHALVIHQYIFCSAVNWKRVVDMSQNDLISGISLNHVYVFPFLLCLYYIKSRFICQVFRCFSCKYNQL